MVKFKGVDLENIVSVDCRMVDVLIEFSGVERSFVKVADGERDGVGSIRSKVVSSPHKVSGEGHLGGEIEMEASAPASAARGPATPSVGVRISVGVGVAIVVVRHREMRE